MTLRFFWGLFFNLSKHDQLSLWLALFVAKSFCAFFVSLNLINFLPSNEFTQNLLQFLLELQEQSVEE